MTYHSLSIAALVEAICDRDEVWLEGHDLKDYYDL